MIYSHIGLDIYATAGVAFLETIFAGVAILKSWLFLFVTRKTVVELSQSQTQYIERMSADRWYTLLTD